MLSAEGTISYYLAKGIVKFGPKVRKQIDTDKALAKQIDELVEESEKVVDEIDSRFNQLNSIADPVADILGAAYKSHPERLNEILNYLKSKNAEIIYKLDEQLGYAPGLSRGIAGQIHIHKEASISSWEHEFRHFLDDEAEGFMGLRALGDTNFRVRTELNAYKTEVDFVKGLKSIEKNKVIEQLKLNFKDELDYLMGRGVVSDKKLLKEIQKFLK